jgi:hypothetical protein
MPDLSGGGGLRRTNLVLYHYPVAFEENQLNYPVILILTTQGYKRQEIKVSE